MLERRTEGSHQEFGQSAMEDEPAGVVRTSSRLRMWLLKASGDYRVVGRRLAVRRSAFGGIRFEKRWTLAPTRGSDESGTPE